MKIKKERRKEREREHATQITLIHSRVWMLILIQSINIRLQYYTLFMGLTLTLLEDSHFSQAPLTKVIIKKNCINWYEFWLETRRAVIPNSSQCRSAHYTFWRTRKHVLNGKASIKKINWLAEASLKRWWTSAAYEWREKWQKEKRWGRKEEKEGEKNKKKGYLLSNKSNQTTDNLNREESFTSEPFKASFPLQHWLCALAMFFLTFFKPLLRLFNMFLCSIQLFSTWYTVALRFGNGFHLLQIFQEKACDHIWLCRSWVFMLPATTRHGGFKKKFGINHGRLLTYVCKASA